MKQFFTITVLLGIQLAPLKAQFVYPNDNCQGAINIPVGNTSLLSDTLYLDDIFADPAFSSIPYCNGSVTAGKYDLWYRFQATDTTLSVATKYYPLNSSVMQYQLFSGDCNSPVSINCYSNSGNTRLTGLVIGEQYLLRSYNPASFSNDNSNFNVNIISKPLNDDCSNALQLQVFNAPSDGVVTKRYTSDLSTVSAGCSAVNTGWTTVNDVWYKFVAGSSFHSVLLQINAGTAKAAVYGGTPGALSVLYNYNLTGSTEVATLSNLVPGQTYYIRVGSTTITEFQLGVFAGAPANDECIHADTVLMSSSQICEHIISVNNRLVATNSTGSCNSATAKDVWFVFKATSDSISVRAIDNTTGLRMGLLEGTCGSLTCLTSTSSAAFSYSGLTTGNYYYLQVGGSGEYGVLNICISPKNTNDECAGAISIPVNPFNQLRQNIVYNGDATQSMQSCTGSNGVRDIWFKFTAVDTACLVTIDRTGKFQVFSGDCNALTSLQCSGTGTLIAGSTSRTEKVSGLVTGSQYYIRVYNSTGGSQVIYSIDVNRLPDNDHCDGAVNLPLQDRLDYEFMQDNGIAYAQESEVPCVAATVTNDIWYRFTANASTAAIISNRQTGNAGNTVLGFEVYSGGCTSLSDITCFSQGTALHKAVTLTGLTNGQTYYVRQYGNFEENRLTVVNAPANDEISGAIRLRPAPSGVTAYPSYYTHGSGSRFGKVCTSSPAAMPHDVWFYFVAESQSHTISTGSGNSFWNEQLSGYTYQLEAFNGFAADSASLAAHIISCASNTLSLSSLTPGDTIYIRVANTGTLGNTSIFSIKVSNVQNMDEPEGALQLDPTNGYQYALSTAGATQSMPPGGCVITDFPDDDIWLKFNAGPAAKRVIAGNESENITMQLYAGTPGNLTLLQCSNNIMLLPPSLTSGNIYYLRTYSKPNNIASSFNIGLFDEPAQSENTCNISAASLGPNLITNPSCESVEYYLVPPIYTGEGYPGKKLVNGWWSAAYSTADGWNADYPIGFGNVPDNSSYGTNKIPRGGKGMLGLLNTSQGGEWSEYVSSKLKQPLTKGKTYLVSFYVSFSEIGQNDVFRIGARFSYDSTEGYLYNNASDANPQVSMANGSVIPSGGKWYNVCGLVYADQEYPYITIGNFGDHTVFGSSLVSYYFIDDVTVAEIDPQVLPLNLLDFRGRMNAR